MSLPIQADPEAKTIGVAIDIPAPWGEQLQNWRAEFGDPMAKAIPPHITLLPPTALHAASSTGCWSTWRRSPPAPAASG